MSKTVHRTLPVHVVAAAVVPLKTRSGRRNQPFTMAANIVRPATAHSRLMGRFRGRKTAASTTNTTTPIRVPHSSEMLWLPVTTMTDKTRRTVGPGVHDLARTR